MSAAHRRRELAAVSAGLEQWLRQRPHYAQARIVQIERPAGAGLSNETFLFDCEIGDRREALVMQIGPAAAGLFRDYDLGVMARVQQQLRNVSSVPVADIKWYEPDASLLGAPFYVMAKVAGRVPSDNPAYHASGWFAESSAPAQSAASG